MQRLVFERRFGLFAAGDVAIDAEHCPRPAAIVELERPAAGDDDCRPIVAGVHVLALPAAGAAELSVDLGQGEREPGLQDRLWRTAQNFCSGPTVELFGAAVPEA